MWRAFVNGPDNNLNDRNMMGKSEGEKPWEDTHLQEYSRENLDKAFKDSGLFIDEIAEGEEINDPGKYNFLFLLKKKEANG